MGRNVLIVFAWASNERLKSSITPRLSKSTFEQTLWKRNLFLVTSVQDKSRSWKETQKSFFKLLLNICISLWLKTTHLLMVTSSRIMPQCSHHHKPVFWTWHWIHCTPKAFSDTKSKSTRNTFKIWWNGRFTSWMCSWQIKVYTKLSSECIHDLCAVKWRACNNPWPNWEDVN